MKFLKITLYTILGLLGLLVLLAFLVPILFKDTIKTKIDEVIAESVDAKVYFDPDKFDISLFEKFPSLTITMKEFGVANNAPFVGDTLVAVSSFQVSVDVMSAISGDQIKINGVYLNNPKIHVIVNKDGKANWDITKPSETPEKEQETSSEPLSLSVEEWKITNGDVIYDDATMPIMAVIKSLNHSGSGKIADVYDLMTKTTIEELSVNFDSTQYLSKNKLDVDMTLNLDLNNSKYTFKENTIKLNDFSFGFDGYFAMPDSLTQEMDIEFHAKETKFKNILSLVPGVFLEGFEQLKTSGSLAFDGFAKGKMVGEQLPTFGLNLQVKEGMFQYPDLPTSVHDVTVDLNVDNQDGIINNTVVDLKKFHMDMGTNPVDMRVLVKGLDVMDIDANVKAKLNLGDLNSIYPIDGLTLKGTFDANIDAKGIYDSTQSILPVVEAKMVLQDGYVKSADVPFPLENMSFVTTASVPNMIEGDVTVQNFRVSVDGEEFVANVYAHNFEDIAYKMGMQGVINLTKMTKVYPIEGMDIQGIVRVDTFSTSGTMALIDAEQYDQLPTAGKITIENFVYADKETLEDKLFKIDNSEMSFTPEKILLSSFNGSVGKSDLQLSGFISNYIPYVFKDHLLSGQMNFASESFDVNEWMTEEEVSVETTTDEEPLSVIEVPKNIDFVLASKLDKVLYDDMDMTNMVGNIIVRDGAVKMQGLEFNMLSGTIGMDGEYNASDLSKPTFDYKLRVQNLGFKDAYNGFSFVKEFSPMAGLIDGKFSTNFDVSGVLGQDMMPLYETMSGKGLINVIDAQLKGIPVLQNVSDALKLNKEVKSTQFVNLLLNAQIKDGRMYYEPFEVDLFGKKTLVSGSTGVDGTVDYKMGMDVPAGSAGQSLNSFLGANAGSDVRLDLGVTGPSTDPSVKILKSSLLGSAKQQVTDRANAEIDVAKKQAEEEARRRKAEAEKAAKDRIEAEKKAAEAEARRKAEAEKKRLEEEAQNKLKNEANKWKNKIKFP